MKVFISHKKGEEMPRVTTTAAASAQNIGVNVRSIFRQVKAKGYYKGKRGFVWVAEVEKCKKRGNPSAFGR